MLQDLTYGRLENEFYDREATEQDLVICVCKNRILVKRTEEFHVTYPTVATVKEWADKNGWKAWGEVHFQYVFRMQDVNYFLWMGDAGDPVDDT